MPDESVIRDLIADVHALREQVGDVPLIAKIEHKLGKLLPPISGKLHLNLPSDYLGKRK